MKATRITYWISTSLTALSLISAGIMYFTSPDVSAGFVHLGFPDYFRIELGIAKTIGGLLIILPGVPRNVREWVYAGIGITFISASIAHAASGDPANMIITPLIQMIIVVTSYYTFARIQRMSAVLTVR